MSHHHCSSLHLFVFVEANSPNIPIPMYSIPLRSCSFSRFRMYAVVSPAELFHYQTEKTVRVVTSGTTYCCSKLMDMMNTFRKSLFEQFLTH